VGILNQNYEYFLKICETGNITQAAQAIGISQPSLSNAVHKLEADERTKLLVRTHRGIRPTAAGLRLEMRLRLALNAAHANPDDSRPPQVLIGCNQSLLPILYGAFLHSATEKRIREVRLVHELSRDCAEGVYHGRLDLAIVAGEVHYPDLIQRPLRKDALFLWRAAETQEAKSTLLFNPGTLRMPVILKNLKKRGLSFENQISSGDYLCLATLTEQGLGYGLIPEIVLASQTRGESLVKVLEEPIAESRVSLIYRRESAVVFKDLIENISKSAAKLDVKKF
jgi:DNA-binding transcriptional LysR family regulator